MGSDHYLSVSDQSEQVSNSKDTKKDTCDAQSGWWRVHARIVIGTRRFVSKNSARSRSPSPERSGLDQNATDSKDPKHDSQSGGGQFNCALQGN